MISDTNILDEFTIKFTKIIKKFTDYIIVSGFVAISSGRTRATEDIDMIIKRISEKQFKKLHDELEKQGFECIQSKDPNTIFEYLISNNPVRYIESKNRLPEMELKFAKDELDNYQLKTRTKLDLTGLDIWFSNINVNIAFKEHLLKSEKDLEDAKHLRIVYQELVDEKEIRYVMELIDKCRNPD